MISKYVKGTRLDNMCFWPMNRLAKGQKTTRESFRYPKKMIKAEPFLTRYPRNEMGAHPFTLQTLRHGINGILHSPKCSKMLQSVSKQNFKKGCCHLCGDRPCFSCGRSKIELSFGNARRCPHLNCCVQNFYAKFFWCVLTWHGQVDWHSLCCNSIIPLWPGKADALSYLYHLFSKPIPPTTAVRIMVLQFTNCYLESSHGFVNLCN